MCRFFKHFSRNVSKDKCYVLRDPKKKKIYDNLCNIEGIKYTLQAYYQLC